MTPQASGGQSPLFVEGQPISKPSEFIYDVGQQEILPNYFQTMEIPLLKGRPFNEQDRVGSERVIIINQELAKRYFPKDDAIGKRIKVAGSPDQDDWWTVVGVVGNLEYTTVFEEMGFNHPPLVFRPYAQASSGSLTIMIRAKSSPTDLVSAARAEIRELDRGLVIGEFQTMDEITSNVLSQPRFRAFLVGAFAGLAMLLAAVGIYGVFSQSVIQRRQEIGIRMALGAMHKDISKLVLGQGIKIVIIGIALGVAGAIALSRVLTSLLFGVRPTDPLTFVMVSLVLMIVALAACYIPACRVRRLIR